jgi:hypothetical protein
MESMVDPARVQAAFATHRARGPELARWELLLPLRLGAPEKNHLSFTFASDVGDVARLFPATLGAAYSTSGSGSHSASGRSVSFKANQIAIGMSTTDSHPAPWDGGVQDAVLKTIATELLASLVSAERWRWTATPFEENDPPPMDAEKARALVLGITEERVFVEFDVDYFLPGESANPDLEVHFHHGETCTQVCASTVPVRAGGSWVPTGVHKVTAVARVSSQPLARWPRATDWKKSRAHDVLWQSAALTVDLRPMHAYRFAVGIPREQRVLTDEERRFIVQPDVKLGQPRELLQLRLVKENAKGP